MVISIGHEKIIVFLIAHPRGRPLRGNWKGWTLSQRRVHPGTKLSSSDPWIWASLHLTCNKTTSLTTNRTTAEPQGWPAAEPSSRTTEGTDRKHWVCGAQSQLYFLEHKAILCKRRRGNTDSAWGMLWNGAFADLVTRPRERMASSVLGEGISALPE